MKKRENLKIHPIIEKLRKIMIDRNITQAAMAEYAEMSPSQFSKIMKGTLQISLWQVSNIATGLGLRDIDIYTYPEVCDFKSDTKTDNEPIKATLQIELKKDKKDQVLKLIFGDNNLEILNK